MLNKGNEMKKLIIALLLIPAFAVAGPNGPIWKSTTALSAGSLSDATLSSKGTFINGYADVSVQGVWIGNGTGTITVQVSNDDVKQTVPGDPAALVTNWIPYTGSAQAVAAPGKFGWDFPLIGYRWIRTQYLKTNGTGSMSIIVNQKSP